MRNLAIPLTLLFALFALPAQALAATLSLSPASAAYNRSCNFALEVLLDTQGDQTAGTDAIIKYDTTRFTALSIAKGTLYDDYPGTNIDESAGTISISALAAFNNSFSGTGTLAQINFQVEANAPLGVSAMTFDFDPNDKAKTTDSNVVESSTVQDILSSVTNGSYTIGQGSCDGSVVVTPAPTNPIGQPGDPSPFITGKPTLPPAGSAEMTVVLAAVGAILTILGILGLALL